MPQPQFIPSPLKIIERRRCQNCGATMMMTGIDANGARHRSALVRMRSMQAMKKSCFQIL